MERSLEMVEVTPDGLAAITGAFGLQDVQRVSRFTECYGSKEEDVRFYDVYLLETEAQRYVIKKTGEREVLNYRRYLSKGSFAVPAFHGALTIGDNQWILLGYIEGDAPTHICDEAVQSAAEALGQIQNMVWPDEEIDRERFAAYRARIEKRGRYADTIPELKTAYEMFRKRQLTAPRTLSHGDLGLFNLCERDGKVVFIDWGFGGIMPYSLDIARFIAHADEDGGPFGMYITERQKQLFVDTLYSNLTQKPPYPEYLQDIRLALLNEYVEFMEVGEDEDGWYEKRALRLAAEITALRG